MEFDGRMSYGDYLHLDRILKAQQTWTDTHDEMLFIIQHQTSELWMKLAIHELRAARSAIAADELQPAFKMLARVARIFEQLNNAWDVLRTMTPSEYTRFREKLGQSSGFQSWQYRMIEYAVGNRNPAMLRPHAHRPDLLATPALWIADGPTDGMVDAVALAGDMGRLVAQEEGDGGAPKEYQPARAYDVTAGAVKVDGYDVRDVTINSLRELMRLTSPEARTPTPIRPVGARSACTGCNSTPAGTVISVDALDNILNIDTFNNTVTAQAGVRIYRLEAYQAGFSLMIFWAVLSVLLVALTKETDCRQITE